MVFGVVELGGLLELLAKIVGSIGAAFGAWKSVIYFIPKHISVKKITNPDDDDFVEMFRLHEHLFKNPLPTTMVTCKGGFKMQIETGKYESIPLTTSCLSQSMKVLSSAICMPHTIKQVLICSSII
jgi:hypothetical protein